MGVPRFAELIRTKYPKCWYNEGEGLVFDTEGKLLGQEVGTLFIDGNGLLHPAMQYTFGYGEFKKKDYGNMSEEDIVGIGAKNFMNAIRALCLEFKPEKVVLAIDGPAPLAKMIQQRQRRFGAKMDITQNPDFKEAWADMIRRSSNKALEDEQSYVTLFIVPDNGQIIERSVQAGTIESEIYRRVRANVEMNLVDWAKREGIIWYNVLSHDCPVGFEFEGRWWWSVGSCACAMVWKEIYGKDTFLNLFSSDNKLPYTLEDPRNHIYTGLSKGKTSSSDVIIHNWVKFKEENSSFIRDHRNKISDACKKISEHLCSKYKIYRDCLINTGIGTSLQGPDRARIDWLMAVRKGLEETQETSTVTTSEYEEGFTDYVSATSSSFDSNSLTPGTVVMSIIDDHIRRNIKDGRFQVSDEIVVELEYSDHLVPGEGEHKIMNYIDQMPVDRKINLVYGLDADLFMLCLIRKANLALVRENRTNADKFRGILPERKPRTASCHLVSISRLRKDLPEHGYMVNHLDFIFLCFMYGNDFLRNVPCLTFDKNLKAVIDKDTSVNAMEYTFNIYNQVKTSLKIDPKDSMFVSMMSRGSPLNIRWLNFYKFVSKMAEVEKQFFSGLIRRMREEEEMEIKLGSSQRPGHVPVKLQYEVLNRCIKIKQKIEGNVINRRARYVDDTEGFNFEEFKEEWAKHITASIPGVERDGISTVFSRTDKTDVLKKISRTFFEGMEWNMRYYTNMHTLANSKSILNVNWSYPYSHAPLMTHLEGFLYEFIQEDARRLHMVVKESTGEMSRDILFYYLNGEKIGTETKRRSTKNEADILSSYPEEMFIKPIKHTKEFLVNERILMEQIPRQVVQPHLRRILSGVRIPRYAGEYVFCGGWAEPHFIFSRNQMKERLISISSTSPEVQLLAVLPAQSSKYFPAMTSPSDLTWMYPSAMPVDFNFKGKLHSAVISIPPPNIPYLENYWITMKSKQYERASEPPVEGLLIDSATDKIRLNFTSLLDYFSSEIDSSMSRSCVVYSTPSGLVAMALSDFFKDVKIFSNTRTKDHTTYLKPNMQKFVAKSKSDTNFSYTSAKINSLDKEDTQLVYIDGFDKRGNSFYHMDSSMMLEDIVAELTSAKIDLIVRIPSPRYIIPRLPSEVRVNKRTDLHETYLHISSLYEEEEDRGRSMMMDRGETRRERERSPSPQRDFGTTVEDITGNPDFKLEVGTSLSDLPHKSDIEAILRNENLGGENVRDIVVINFGDGGLVANALDERYSNVVIYESSASKASVISSNFPDLRVEVGLPEPSDNTLYFITSNDDYQKYISEGAESIVVVKARYEMEIKDFVDRVEISEETSFSKLYNLYIFASG